MSNPFLFDDEVEPVANEPAAAAPNPFLLSNEPDEGDEAENPFLSEASNPFAFDADDQSTVQTVADVPNVSESPAVDKAMSFFGTTITEDDDHASTEQTQTPFATNESDSVKKPPPPRPTPPNPTTQDLISSVADQLDQTSSHLLDRIPKTRTPSPVSMRDLHTPSPTPDTANLLMSDVLEPSTALRSDNPFADVEDEPPFAVAQQKIPPRPAAPPRPSPPEQNVPAPQQSENEADLFDFGTITAPKPPAPKSNQDILSLFSTPKAEPQKPDLLTSDILLMNNVTSAPIQSNLPSAVITNAAPVIPPSVPVAPAIPPAVPAAPVIPPSVPVAPVIPPTVPVAPVVPVVPPAPVVSAPIPAPVAAPVVNAPPARPAPPQRPAAPPQRPAPPVVPKPPVIEPIVPAAADRKPSIPSAPSVEEIPKVAEEQPEPIDSVPIKINDEPYNGVHDNVDKSDTISDNSSAIDSSIRTPGIATPFYSPGPDAQYLDRGQTPVDHQLNSAKQDMINTYINETSTYNASEESNPFGSPEGAVTPQPAVQPAQAAFPQNDAFDAFAAKFDSVKKDEGLLDSFGVSSGYKSPAPSDGKFI